MERYGVLIYVESLLVKCLHMFNATKVQRLPWCPYPSGLCVVGLTWSWMKRRTTKQETPNSIQEAIIVWIQTWQDLSSSLSAHASLLNPIEATSRIM